MSAKNKLGCEAGCGLTARVHGRIILGTVSDRSRIVNDGFHQISVILWTVILRAKGPQYLVRLEDESCCPPYCK